MSFVPCGTPCMKEKLHKGIRSSELPEPCRRFLRLTREVNFGSILDLHVRDGLPVWRPRPRIVQVHKMDGAQDPPRLPRGDFVLKDGTVRFFELLLEMGTGVVTEIKVTHGLPAFVSIESEARV